MNTETVSGILWRHDPERKRLAKFRPTSGGGFPMQPGTSVEMLGPADPPKVVLPSSPGDVFCYWDDAEGEWICPPEPAP